MANFICFDLEGPLSPQDNAYELMKLFPNGDRIFKVISRYDDLLTLEEKEDYEPGDTLALIVPFLILHNITENDIASLAVKATFTSGAIDLISYPWTISNEKIKKDFGFVFRYDSRSAFAEFAKQFQAHPKKHQP